VTAVTLAAGSRGNVYGDYAAEYPDRLRIVGVAEPIPIRQERYARKHAITDERRFVTWEHVFERPKPYFVTMRELMQSGAIGQVVSIQHMEPIEHVHMAHSYVRGNWHNSVATTPIILAKSSHDLDILRWMIGRESSSIHAFGDLSWFTAANAPQGSTARCMDGCAVESTCPYSALRIYHRDRQRLYVFDLPDDRTEWDSAILDYLRTTDYGRCVYRMDNDQCDHYVANILFAGGVTASFSMEAFTPFGGRRTRVMGSMGYIEGDMSEMRIVDFRTRHSTVLESSALNVDQFAADGHGGGDWRLVANWVEAVATQNASLLSSTIDVSIESHLICTDGGVAAPADGSAAPVGRPRACHLCRAPLISADAERGPRNSPQKPARETSAPWARLPTSQPMPPATTIPALKEPQLAPAGAVGRTVAFRVGCAGIGVGVRAIRRCAMARGRSVVRQALASCGQRSVLA
jgi:hypothetical protein